MKKHLPFLIPIALISFVVIFAGFEPGNMDTSNGAPPGYTNSPADGMNCTHCMGGSAVPVTGWITSDIPTDGYYPDSTYTITVTATGSGKKGFEVSPQDLSGTLIGTLTAGTGSKLVGVNKYITHSAAQSANPYIWTFNWKAPTAGVGDVTFYGSIIVSKLNTKTTTLTVPQSTVGVKQITSKSFSIFPNPVHDRLSISFLNPSEGVVKMQLVNLNGQTVRTLLNESLAAGEVNRSFSNDLPAGVYLLKLKSGKEEFVKQVIVQ
ncbi:MAG: choice-of-anchor V domain-containing protein [Bacteroidota bacterium]